MSRPPRRRLSLPGDRARIPLALVGALLLVSAATVAATVGVDRPAVVSEDRTLAEERAVASAETVFRSSVERAAADAAASPVVTPADTEYGAAIRPEQPFRDALRIRIYLELRERLPTASEHVGDHVVTPTLPPIDDPDGLRAARDRVTIEDRGDGALFVRVEGVRLEHDAPVGGDGTHSLEATVATPAVTMHDRTAAFDERLNRSALAGPGAERGVTARLYLMGYARGYAQYGGAPIDDVLTNRHAALATNAAIVDQQRATFGTHDETAAAEVSRSSVRVGLLDGLAPTPADEEALVDDLVGTEPTGVEPGVGRLAGPEPERSEPPGTDAEEGLALPEAAATADDEIEVGVNGTADRAFVDAVDRGGLDEAIDRAYAVDVAYEADVTLVDRTTEKPFERPTGWERVGETSRETVRDRTLLETERGPLGDALGTFTVRVVVEETTVHEWQRGDRTTETVERSRATHHVSVDLVADPVEGVATDAAVDWTAAEPDRRDALAEAVWRERVEAAGGPERVAVRLYRGDGSTDGRVAVDPPDSLSASLADDLAALSAEVRERTYSEERSRLATGADPHRKLADELDADRDALVEDPGGGLAPRERAAVDARTHYLELVAAGLDERSDAADRSEAELESGIEEQDGGLIGEELDAVVDAAVGHDPPATEPLDPAPPAERVPMRVDTQPSTLRLDPLDAETVPAAAGEEEFHSLGVRTVTVGGIPYEDAAASGIDRLFGGERDEVRFETAARLLAATEPIEDDELNATVSRDRAALEAGVEDGLTRVEAETLAALPREIPAADRRAIVDDASAEWESPAERGMAAADGRLADAVVDRTVAHETVDPADRTRIEPRVRVAVGGTVDDATVTLPEDGRSRTDDLAEDHARAVAADAVANATEEGVERAGEAAADAIEDRLGTQFVTVPRGVPITPIAGHWYVTTNAWVVSVEGTFAQVTVEADHGGPAGGGTTTYVRDGSTVAWDVTGDGERERLGHADRVTVDVGTTVVVVVPPGPPGVGNDGSLERSPGWGSVAAASPEA